jgi:hypothetical protein
MQALSNDTPGKVAGKMAYPLPGALLPIINHRLYGNLYSTRMGILGEIQELK